MSENKENTKDVLKRHIAIFWIDHNENWPEHPDIYRGARAKPPSGESEYSDQATKSKGIHSQDEDSMSPLPSKNQYLTRYYKPTEWLNLTTGNKAEFT